MCDQLFPHVSLEVLSTCSMSFQLCEGLRIIHDFSLTDQSNDNLVTNYLPYALIYKLSMY